MAAPLSDLVSDIVGRAFHRRGFTVPALVTEWPAIVGTDLARSTLPLKIVFPRGERIGGVLHIRVEGAFALELQHMEPLLIERLNGFYGYAALARLALHQGPVTSREHPAPQGRAPKNSTTANRFADRADPSGLQEIEDQGLKDALQGLGRAIRTDLAAPNPRETRDR